MKCKASHPVKYEGTWYKAGDVFNIFKGDAEEMKAHGEVIEEAKDKAEKKPEEKVQEEPVQEETTPEEPVQETTARRGRRRKIEEA